MKRKILWAILFVLMSVVSSAQINNPISIYEGTLIQSVNFHYNNPPADTMLFNAYVKIVQSTFRITPQSHFDSFLTSYYISKLNLLPFVSNATPQVLFTSQSDVALTVVVNFSAVEQKEVKHENIAKDAKLFPVLYNSDRTFLTLKAAASEMAYSNNNTWFAQPGKLTNGNPLADKPSGKGYSAWLEGFVSAGVYGIVKVIPKINLHVYGGTNYLVSFSAGDELFTQKSRIFGALEEAFAGFIGGGRLNGKIYKYNLTYGRKQFTLGDGWLIINTSMNGYDRGALQLNPRWAGKNLIQGGVVWDKYHLQGFSLQPNELGILNSRTIINGANFELRNNTGGLLGLSFLYVPRSNFHYYLPNGTSYTRDGLQVYNVRIFKTAGKEGGLFFKAEGGYQRNSNFDMSAWAYYGELGWNFKKMKRAPSFSYRFAYFSGDNPDTKSYNRWDALYTGGNGEQWVQGSNMYKIVQNSNEITHRIQAVSQLLKKMQVVGQFWLFYAAQKNNIGGNPALSALNSKFYGTEFNLTLKYFYSRSWYFHLNTAYTLPGNAIKDNVLGTKNWFCLSFFARYSF